MENYRFNKADIPKKIAERISDTLECFPKTFNTPQMSSVDATYHASQNLIYLLQNPEPEMPIVKLGHVHKEAFNTLADIFRKANPSAVPPRGPVREVRQNKLQ